MSLAGVLVFCRVSDSRSPAIAGLLVVAFFTSLMASRGGGPEKTVGIALRLWVAWDDRQFPKMVEDREREDHISEDDEVEFGGVNVHLLNCVLKINEESRNLDTKL
ncbi:hypothetical protein D5086_030580 [Populus alba]|uniref:Uncharacterized protein n=1 Tax=Populus alba TaxID=43335 RepID=A0ACC4ANX2_POPAL